MRRKRASRFTVIRVTTTFDNRLNCFSGFSLPSVECVFIDLYATGKTQSSTNVMENHASVKHLRQPPSIMTIVYETMARDVCIKIRSFRRLRCAYVTPFKNQSGLLRLFYGFLFRLADLTSRRKQSRGRVIFAAFAEHRPTKRIYNNR